MSYFQNPFTADYHGNLLLADRQLSLSFICPRHSGRSDVAVSSWRSGLFDFDGNDADGNPKNILRIGYAYGPSEFKNWSYIDVDMSFDAADQTAVTVAEVITSLQGQSLFSDSFTILPNNGRLTIQQKKDSTRMRFFIVNGGAEEVLRFNARAGVAELPTYFMRHTVSQQPNFPDSLGCLVLLSPDTSDVDHSVISSATDNQGNSRGFDPDVVQADWALLRGRSGLFQFTVVNSGVKLVYSAGARVGDLAMKIVESGDNKFEMPHTLTADDLVTPP